MNDATTPGRRLAIHLGMYTVVRLLLVVVLAAIILGIAKVAGVDLPLLVALIFAIVIALPTSMLLFRSLRRKVNEDIAAVDERRRRDKAQLRAKLRGDTPETDGDPAQR